MHCAVANEDLGVLRTLIDNDLSLSSQLDDDGHSPLSLAITEEKYHCAKILLTAGVDVNSGGGPLGSCLNIAVDKA
jgi:ankyrin repeat protein